MKVCMRRKWFDQRMLAVGYYVLADRNEIKKVKPQHTFNFMLQRCPTRYFSWLESQGLWVKNFDGKTINGN